jgi:uncharacterized 2Fe-2S/4Fe-4S cluster protein (DUF4445 family)
MPIITFIPANRSIDVAVGTSLLDAAALAGVTIPAPCGGEGVCGECRVRVTSGAVERLERGGLSPDELAEGWALACSSRVLTDATIEVIARSTEQEAGAARIVSSAESTSLQVPAVGAAEPPAVKHALRVPSPELGKGLCDYERLAQALSDGGGPERATATLDVLRELAAALRVRDGEVTVTVAEEDTGTRGRGDTGKDAGAESPRRRVPVSPCPFPPGAHILRIEPGDTTNRQFGLAIDVGTTTCVVSLVDLARNHLLGTAADYNGQLARGADIISRINYARTPERLDDLRRLVLDTLNRLVGGLCHQHDCQPAEVTCVAIAGNTTMSHLLLGLDPQYIRLEPYTPTINQPPRLRAVEVGLDVHPATCVVIAPSVGSYVGGDITAGLLRTALAGPIEEDTETRGRGDKEKDTGRTSPRHPLTASPRPHSEAVRMFLDIGTNGEIVVGTGEWLMACAASAGPAFEGSGVGCGMRATQGAIERVAIDADTGEPSITVIGGGRPRGVCGSGMIDLLAELWLAGLLDQSGKLHPERGGGRIRPAEGSTRNLEYLIVPAEASETGQPITLDERDIQNLLRTKAAVYAAGSLMLQSVGLDLSAVTEVYVAGGFGRYLDLRKAILIGLLPDLPLERFTYLGNSSLAGAQMMLCSAAARRRVLDVARRITYLDLNADPAYMNEYTAGLFLPHTDIERFPTVKAMKRK